MASLDHVLGKVGVVTRSGATPVHGALNRQSGDGNERPLTAAEDGNSRADNIARGSDLKSAAEDGSQPPSGTMANVQRMTKVLAAAQAQTAHIVGVTGTQSGVGVSIVTRELAAAFAGFGKKTLLVDLSHTPLAESTQDAEAVATLPAPESAIWAGAQLFVVKSEALKPRSMTAVQLRAALSEFVQSGFVVVVDLPPVLATNGSISPSIAALAEVCDQVFLVCLTGKILAKELSACVEACSIVGMKPAGLILNDWQMFASELVTD